MKKTTVSKYDNESLEIAQMFTRAIDIVFRGDRANSKDIGEASAGRRKQEATAQALLDYILRQDNEAANFARALKYRGGVWNNDKEVSFTAGNRVDHVLYRESTPTIYIEDKLWAQFGPDQLKRYEKELIDSNSDGLLIVLVPDRRQDEATREMNDSHVSDSTQIITWRELPNLAAKFSGKPHLWNALSTYAEEAGSSNLIELAASNSFPQSREIAEHISLFLASADETSELFHEASGKARGTTPTRRRFQVSTNQTNERPWLQSGATGVKNWGLDIDLGYDGRSGIWLFHQKSDNFFDPKIGYFRNSLSQAARQRVDEIARRCVDEDSQLDIAEGEFRRLGTFLTHNEQNSLNVLLHVFDVRTARNYLPTDTVFTGVNEDIYRHGMRFSSGERSVETFLGPQVGSVWLRPSVFIWSDDDEFEVRPKKRQSGKDYVLTVWQKINDLLLP